MVALDKHGIHSRFDIPTMTKRLHRVGGWVNDSLRNSLKEKRKSQKNMRVK
jgi:hypothetical protein